MCSDFISMKRTENVIASLKRGQKGKQRMQRRNKFSFSSVIAHVQLNQFEHLGD